MPYLPFKRSRRRLIGAAGASTALLVLAVALVLVLGGSSGGSRYRLVAQAACPPGTSLAEGPVADGGDHAGQGSEKAGRDGAGRDGDRAGRACVPLGQPETFQDLETSNTQLGARETAPFASAAAGAYASAVAQRAKLAAFDAGTTWTVAGSPPECGAQTTQSNTCPPPSAENGQYNGVGTLGFRTLSGRISSFAYDPSTQGRYFASPVIGGVWETRDAGGSWRSIGDGLPTQVIGAIAYDAPLHRVIAGSGDNSFGGSGVAGHGIYYSDDDGMTWKTASGIPDLILSFKLVVSPADASGKTIYAATSEGLFRSTDGGVSFVNENLPTSPAGYSPNCAGVTAGTPGGTISHLCFFANDVTDVVVKATKTANGPAGAVIAAVGWRAGQKVDTDASGNPVTTCKQNGSATNCLQAPQNGLYTSATGAPGSFAYITPSGNPPAGLPATNIFGRTALAIAHGAGQNSDAVYALVQDAQKFNGCPDVLDQAPPKGACNGTVTGEGIATVLNGMYASYDFGKTWTKIMDYTQLKQPGTNSALLGQAGYNPGVQAWYNLWVEADPTATESGTGDPTRVIFGLEEVWENNHVLPSGSAPGSVLATPYTAYPGGSAATDPWQVIGRYWNACGGLAASPVSCNPGTSASPLPGSTTHPDQHAYAMIPDGKGGVTLLVGSDGGAYSQHVDSGQDFSNDNWGDGLNRTISAVQPYDAEMAKDGTIVSGLQDNGEMKTAPDGHEAEIYGGDAFFNTIDPNNSKNILEEYTYAALSLTTDGGTTWYSISPTGSDPTGTTTAPCGSSTALFSTPIEQDPTMPGHVLVGCTQVQETPDVYSASCADPSCSTVNTPSWTTAFDLSTLPSPNGATNVPSALAVRGANEYVAYCGYCDPATQKIPFANGIATNVGGSAPPKIGASDGWHKASAKCSGCGTANGLLPERYINSIQEDPGDPNTIYVTLGGYGRRWIPPGSFGEDTSNVGVGHVFVSHDHGESFTNITGNLPDISANWTAFHNGQLVVATDLGVYVETSAGSGGVHPTYAVLGKGLPAVPVFTVRVDPANANRLLISTYGRGDWFYTFPTTPIKVPTVLHCPKPSGSITGTRLGPLSLGMTRSRARRLLKHYRIQRSVMDDFCLAGGTGIRAGIPSSKLLRSVSAARRRSLSGRLVLILTSNRHYALDGVRPKTALTAATRRLGRRAESLRIGANLWFVYKRRGVSWVLLVRHRKVQEIGIAARSMTGNRRADRRFLSSFQ